MPHRLLTLRLKLSRLACLGMLLAVLTAPAAAGPPNIVLIFSDDQGMNDVGCYGSEIPTPHIDSLARQGARFTDFYVAAPVCTPSRYGLLTGRHPGRSRDRLLGPLMFLEGPDKERGIRPGETTIAQVLRERGYQTALIGKWHLGHGDAAFLPTRFGFDRFIGHTGGCIDYFTMTYGIQPDWYHGERHVPATGFATDLITDHAIEFLGRRDRERPFFLYLPYNAPHFSKGYNFGKAGTANTLQAKPEDLARFPQIEELPRKYFAAMVANLDDNIGRLLTALRELRLEADTLVIFTCDNGGDPVYGGSNRPYRGVKKEHFEGGIRVPCVMRFPGRIKPGSVVRQPASTLDFLPTFCALAGADVGPLRPDGVNLLPMFTGKIITRDLHWHAGATGAFRRGDWKYVREGERDWLFHLGDDPHEQTDLAAAERARLTELKQAHAAVVGTFPTKR